MVRAPIPRARSARGIRSLRSHTNTASTTCWWPDAFARSPSRLPLLHLSPTFFAWHPTTNRHLFLSHSWANQDTVATIKRQLQLLLPGVRVFLDVDHLEEIGDLEGYITRSSTVLVYCSKYYFQSKNCLRELVRHDRSLLSNSGPQHHLACAC